VPEIENTESVLSMTAVRMLDFPTPLGPETTIR
jgi:hypothetical protein